MAIKCQKYNNQEECKKLHFRKAEKKSYNFTLGDIVEEDEIAEHGDEAEETKPSHNVDHCVLQVKLSWNLKQSRVNFIVTFVETDKNTFVSVLKLTLPPHLLSLGR